MIVVSIIRYITWRIQYFLWEGHRPHRGQPDYINRNWSMGMGAFREPPFFRCWWYLMSKLLSYCPQYRILLSGPLSIKFSLKYYVMDAWWRENNIWSLKLSTTRYLDFVCFLHCLFVINFKLHLNFSAGYLRDGSLNSNERLRMWRLRRLPRLRRRRH